MIAAATGDEWPIEWHAVPDGLRAGEPHPPGSFAYNVDQARVAPDDSDVPLDAIEGCFLIGSDGRATGEFRRNVRYVPDGDDFALLESPDLHLEWLSSPPGVAIRTSLTELFAEQLPGAVLRHVHVVDRPRTRMAGRAIDLPPEQWPPGVPPEGGYQAMMLTAAALAVTVTLWIVRPDGTGALLHGVLTLVAVGLDGDAPDRALWLEPERRLDAAEQELDERIAAVQAEPRS